jgi:hypothetical protein
MSERSFTAVRTLDLEVLLLAVVEPPASDSSADSKESKVAAPFAASRASAAFLRKERRPERNSMPTRNARSGPCRPVK